jgi:hypothetical protein
MMPALFEAEDAIGTVHYSRFTGLSETTLLFLGDFDGEFTQLVTELAKHAGPVFDAIFQHVVNPPATPVADNADAFVEWTAEHLVHPLNVYTAYSDVTAKEVKALAAAADVSGGSEQRPFLVILPTRSRLPFIEIQLLLRGRSGRARGTGGRHRAKCAPELDRRLWDRLRSCSGDSARPQSGGHYGLKPRNGSI